MIIPEKVWDLPDSQLQKQKSRWVILLPGKENALSNTLLTKMCLHDYENLCTLNMRTITNLFMWNLEKSWVEILLGTLKPTLSGKSVILYYVEMK